MSTNNGLDHTETTTSDDNSDQQAPRLNSMSHPEKDRSGWNSSSVNQDHRVSGVNRAEGGGESEQVNNHGDESRKTAHQGGPGAVHARSDDKNLPTFKDQVRDQQRGASDANIRGDSPADSAYSPTSANHRIDRARKQKAAQEELLRNRFHSIRDRESTPRTPGPGAIPFQTGGPTFKDQVSDRSANQSGNDAFVAQTACETSSRVPEADGVGLPDFKDQVRQWQGERQNDGSNSGGDSKDVKKILRDQAAPGLPAGVDHVQTDSGLPTFKDQVRDRQHEQLNAERDSGFNSARNFAENDGEVEFEEQENHLNGTLLGHRGSSDGSDMVAIDEDTLNLIAAVRVNEIEAAQVVVERRHLKRNACIILVLLNMIMVAALLIGGTCLLGDCVFENENKSKVQTENVSCIVDVRVTCENSNGTICSELQPPDTTDCSAQLTAIRFQYWKEVCDPTQNMQPDSECLDLAPLAISRPIEIQCFEDDGNVLQVEPSFVEKYEKFTVSTIADNEEFPDKVVCQLIGNGNVLQQIEIDTSGNVPLEPYDQFGAILVDQCSNPGCSDVLSYGVTVQNTNRNTLTVSAIEFAPSDGSLVDLLSDFGPVEAGGAVKVTHDVKVDLCLNSDSGYLAWAFVESTLDSGVECRGGDEFSPTMPPSPSPTMPPSPPPIEEESENDESKDCSITVNVGCMTVNGMDCFGLQGANPSCGSSFSLLQFRYDYEYYCDPVEHNQGEDASCQDLAPLVDGPIIVQCEIWDGDAIRVEPTYVNGWERKFSVVPPESQYPEKIGCSLIKEDGTVMQTNSIDTSGFVELNLGDRFGAMQVVGCSAMDCAANLTYSVTISNIGEVPALLSSLELEFNDRLYTSDDPYPPILVNQSLSEQIEVSWDACLGESTVVDVSISAISIATESSFGYCFSEVSFDPENPEPAECEVSSFVSCLLSDGRPCSEIESRESSCSDQELVALEFRYRALGCGGQDLPSICTDFGPIEAEIDIQCVDENGIQLAVHPPEVELYDTFTVSKLDGGILDGTVDCTLLGLEGQILQRNVIDISRFQDVEGKARSGAMVLVACSSSSCREILSYNITVNNDGSQPLFITELDVHGSDAVEQDLPNSFVPYLAKNPLAVGESTSVVVDLERDVCLGSLLTRAEPEVSAETSTGMTCGNDYTGSASSSGSGDPGFSEPPVPPPLPIPTSSPADRDTLSSESIFGLVALGIAVEMLICVGLYVYYQRWKARRMVGTTPTKKE